MLETYLSVGRLPPRFRPRTATSTMVERRTAKAEPTISICGVLMIRSTSPDFSLSTSSAAVFWTSSSTAWWFMLEYRYVLKQKSERALLSPAPGGGRQDIYTGGRRARHAGAEVASIVHAFAGGRADTLLQ